MEWSTVQSCLAAPSSRSAKSGTGKSQITLALGLSARPDRRIYDPLPVLSIGVQSFFWRLLLEIVRDQAKGNHRMGRTAIGGQQVNPSSPTDFGIGQ
jgi:hypothetical protein